VKAKKRFHSIGAAGNFKQADRPIGLTISNDPFTHCQALFLCTRLLEKADNSCYLI